MSHLVFWGGVGNFCHASWPLTIYLVLTWISKFEHFCCSLLKTLILVFLRSSVKYFSEPNIEFKTGRCCQNPMTWEKPWLLPSNVPPPRPTSVGHVFGLDQFIKCSHACENLNLCYSE